jgi:hypothetical protein
VWRALLADVKANRRRHLNTAMRTAVAGR